MTRLVRLVESSSCQLRSALHYIQGNGSNDASLPNDSICVIRITLLTTVQGRIFVKGISKWFNSINTIPWSVVFRLKYFKWLPLSYRTTRSPCIWTSTGTTIAWLSVPSIRTSKWLWPASLPLAFGCQIHFLPTISILSCTMWRNRIKWSVCREMDTSCTECGEFKEMFHKFEKRRKKAQIVLF